MAKPLSASEASIEDMLSTIRRAIDEESARASEGEDGAANAPVSGTMREMRVSLQPGGTGGQGSIASRSDDFMAHRPGNEPPAAAKTTVTGGNKAFSGIMGGDVRLEEALSRMHQAERRQQSNQPVASTVRNPGEPRLELSPRPQPAVPPQQSPIAPQPARSAASSSDPGGYELEMQGQARSVDPAYVQCGPDGRPEQHQRTTAQPAPELPARPGLTERLQPVHAQPEPRPATPAPLEPAHHRTTPTVPEIEAMISEEAMRATSNAFNRLNEEILLRSMGGEERLSAAVREMIRPMLSAWLDRNLPQLAERLVREEIERVVRRGGR